LGLVQGGKEGKEGEKIRKRFFNTYVKGARSGQKNVRQNQKLFKLSQFRRLRREETFWFQGIPLAKNQETEVYL